MSVVVEDEALKIAPELCVIAEESPEGYLGTVDGMENLIGLAKAGVAGGLSLGENQQVLYSIAAGYCPLAIGPMTTTGFFGKRVSVDEALESGFGYYPDYSLLNSCYLQTDGANQDRRFGFSPLYDLCAVADAAPDKKSTE